MARSMKDAWIGGYLVSKIKINTQTETKVTNLELREFECEEN